MKILIVGAGIAGLSLANFLNSSDCEILVIDKAPNFNHLGFSLGMWSNGRHMFEKLGLVEEFDSHAVAERFLEVRSARGELIRRVNLKNFFTDFGMAYSHIRRKDLHDWLISRLAPEMVKLNTTVSELNQVEEVVKVVFSDRSVGNFDLVIGADGMNSQIRSLVFPNTSKIPENLRAWFLWLDHKYAKSKSVVEYLAPNKEVAIFDEGDKALAAFVAKKVDGWDDEQGRIERLENTFKEFTFLTPDIFANLNPRDVVPTDLYEIPLKNMVSGRVALIGDAAHGFEPFAGLAGSMAMEDAYVLSEKILQSREGAGDLEKLLADFEQTRMIRVTEAKNITKRMKRWSIISSDFIRKLVNSISPLIPNRIFMSRYEKFLTEKI